MPDQQVRSVTVALKANFSAYDAATARSAAVTKKATNEMAAAARSAAAQVDAAAQKTAGAQQRAARDVEKAAASAQRAAAREETAARKSAATAEREAQKKAVAAERAAAREEAAVRRMAAVEAAAYREQTARAAAAQRAARQAAAERRQAMSDLGSTLGMASAAVLAASAVAVKGFADFEAQMSRVGAAMDANADQMSRLKSAALEAGAATKYSATDAARAEEELGKAGLSVQEIIGGGLKASMSLAAAGNMELADSAEIAATTMKTFGMDASEVPRVADALSAGAGKAVGSVQELGYALKMSGLVANQLGLSMTDTVGTLAAFAQNALLGSDAGTSFKTMLSFLHPKSAAAAGAMKELGLDFYDAQGRFVGITAAAGQLQTKMSGLTQEQRQAAMYTIFGSDAIRAANILYREGAAGIQKWIDAVEDEGYAARVAAKAQDNLRGDIEKLGGAIETALIESGGGGASGLRSLTRAATKAVDAFSSLPAPVSETLTVVGLLGGSVGLIAAGFLKAVPAIAEFRAAAATMNITMATTRTRAASMARFMTGPWGIALAAGTAVFTAWASKQAAAKENVRALTDTLNEQTGAVGGNTRAWVSKKLIDDGMLDSARKYGLSLETITAAAMGSASSMNAVADAVERFKAANQGPGHIVAQEWQSADKFRSSLAEMSGQLEKAKRDKAEYIKVNKGVASSANGEAVAVSAATARAAGFTVETDNATKSADHFAKVEKQLKNALDASNNSFLAGRDARREYLRSIQATNEARKQNGRVLDEETEKGRSNAEALDAQARAALSYLKIIHDQKGAGKEFAAAIREVERDLVGAAEKMGMTEAAAKRYANRILRIPKKAVTAFEMRNIERAKQQAAELYSRVRSMPMKKTITLSVREVYQNYGGDRAARERYRSAGLLRRAEGGPIPAHLGTPGRDSVPILAMPGEFVVRATQARAHLPLLEAINAGRVSRFAEGGQVGVRAPSVAAVPQVVMVPVSETHTTAATVHVGTVYARDAGSFVSWGARRSFDAVGGIH